METFASLFGALLCRDSRKSDSIYTTIEARSQAPRKEVLSTTLHLPNFKIKTKHLVLDLDETLVHTKVSQADKAAKVEP